MVKRRFPAFLASAVLVACSAGGDADNRAVVDRYFATLGAGDINAALGLYSETFFRATSRDDWARALHGMRDRCGGVRAHKLTRWSQSRLLFSGAASGSSSVLIYDVTYDSCRVTEAFTVFKPADGKPQIVSQNIKVRQQSDARAQSV
jgi:hypothetical protein